MKNLKKVLSLVLALAMAMSLMTTAFAAGTDFSDKSEIKNTKAVEVMAAIGVLEGNNGKFDPNGTLTREQAAKIITYMMLGKEDADKLTADIAPYSDVKADRWSAGAIAYCTNERIMVGNGKGKFNPTAKLTGQQFAKTLLVALGYDPRIENLEGNSWAINTSKMAVTTGLSNGVGAMSMPMTREAAAQMAFNTLTANLVEYQGGTEITTPDGTNVIVGATRYNVAAPSTTTGGNTVYKGYKDQNNDERVQFCERYLPKLQLKTTSNTDKFDAPAATWSFKGSDIGTYAVDPFKTFTEEVAGDTAADQVKTMGLKNFKVTATKYYVNGHEETLAGGDDAARLATIAGLTANGDKVMLYTEGANANEITDVVVIRTQLMQVNSVNTTTKTVTLKEIADADKVNTTTVTMKPVKEDDDCYAELSNMKKDDYVLVTPAETKTVNTYEVAAVATPKTVTGKLTAVTLDKTATTAVALDGVSYNVAKTACPAFDSAIAVTPNTKTDSTIYVDEYGFVKYITDVTAATNYAFVADKYESLIDNRIVDMVNVITTTGEVMTLNLGNKGAGVIGAGTVVTYKTADATASAKGAEYEIKAATAATGTGNTEGVVTPTAAIKASDIRMTVGGNNPIYADGVKFVFLTNDNGVYTVNETKDGVQAVADYSKAKALYTKVGDDMRISTVFVEGEAETATGAEVAYVAEKTGTTSVGNKKADIYTIYFDGAEKTGCISTDLGLVGKFVTFKDNGGNYTLKEYTKDNAVTSVKVDAVIKSNDNGLMKIDGIANELDARNAQLINLSDDNTIGSVSDLKKDSTKVSIVYNASSSNKDYNKVTHIFVLDTKYVAPVPHTVKVTPTNANGLTITAPADSTPNENEQVTLEIKVKGTATKDGKVVLSNMPAGATVAMTGSGLTQAGDDKTYTVAKSAAVDATLTVKFTLGTSDVNISAVASENAPVQQTLTANKAEAKGVTLTADPATATQKNEGERVTVTYTVGGTANAAATITLTGVPAGATVSLAGGATNLTKDSNTQFTIAAASAVSGTITIAFDMPAGSATTITATVA